MTHKEVSQAHPGLPLDHDYIPGSHSLKDPRSLRLIKDNKYHSCLRMPSNEVEPPSSPYGVSEQRPLG